VVERDVDYYGDRALCAPYLYHYQHVLVPRGFWEDYDRGGGRVAGAVEPPLAGGAQAGSGGGASILRLRAPPLLCRLDRDRSGGGSARLAVGGGRE